MDAATLLHELQAEGFTIRADGGRLILSPAGRLGERRKALVREHKPALLAIIAQGKEQPPPNADIGGAIRDYARLHGYDPARLAKALAYAQAHPQEAYVWLCRWVECWEQAEAACLPMPWLCPRPEDPPKPPCQPQGDTHA